MSVFLPSLGEPTPAPILQLAEKSCEKKIDETGIFGYTDSEWPCMVNYYVLLRSKLTVEHDKKLYQEVYL